ncbi:unnamed protein product [Linum tenue]|uniref:Uncharacterized protein n=1 Tax=Linum tenue TaxID=586396 RepID=A0AAV0JRF8_9ROSI|nr:unnamed protein product [Linum tenue]
MTMAFAYQISLMYLYGKINENIFAKLQMVPFFQGESNNWECDTRDIALQLVLLAEAHWKGGISHLSAP